MNTDTFERSGCSDTQSNCHEEGLEGLASEQCARDEGSDEDITVVEENKDNSCHSSQTEKLINGWQHS
jgi:hypothetical protein